MISPIAVQIMIEEAITDREVSADAKYHLCFFDDKLRCHLRNHTRLPHEVFYPITPTEMRQGFSVDTWDMLSGQIRTYLESIQKCHEHQKQ